MKPRWRKVLHDLVDNKGRTLLVVFSIAVGVFSIGVIAGAYQIISNDMSVSYSSNHPANIELRMLDFDERPERALDMLKLVDLETFANKLPVLVSTGQQQLAAIARALACDPPLLVADEPTGNLDSKSANIIIDLFEELSRRGKTVVMVTHDPSLTSRTTRNIIIADGKLIVDSSKNTLPFENKL